MPIRVVELFRLGSFRFAVRPGTFGLDWNEGFSALEEQLSQIAAGLATLPYERFLDPRPEDFPERPGPPLDGRRGSVHLVVLPSVPEESMNVLLRGSITFRRWPLGGWVVWHGFRTSPDGSHAPLTDDDLATVW